MLLVRAKAGEISDRRSRAVVIVPGMAVTAASMNSQPSSSSSALHYPKRWPLSQLRVDALRVHTSWLAVERGSRVCAGVPVEHPRDFPALHRASNDQRNAQVVVGAENALRIFREEKPLHAVNPEVLSRLRT